MTNVTKNEAKAIAEKKDPMAYYTGYSEYDEVSYYFFSNPMLPGASFMVAGDNGEIMPVPSSMVPEHPETE